MHSQMLRLKFPVFSTVAIAIPSQPLVPMFQWLFVVGAIAIRETPPPCDCIRVFKLKLCGSHPRQQPARRQTINLFTTRKSSLPDGGQRTRDCRFCSRWIPARNTPAEVSSSAEPSNWSMPRWMLAAVFYAEPSGPSSSSSSSATGVIRLTAAVRRALLGLESQCERPHQKDDIQRRSAPQKLLTWISRNSTVSMKTALCRDVRWVATHRLSKRTCASPFMLVSRRLTVGRRDANTLRTDCEHVWAKQSDVESASDFAGACRGP